MSYIKVKNNQIVEEEFPQEYKTPINDGYLINKTTEFLRAEGWLPLFQDRPRFDSNTQYLKFSHYNILEDKVIGIYEVIDKPNIETIEQEELEITNEIIDDTEEDDEYFHSIKHGDNILYN